LNDAALFGHAPRRPRGRLLLLALVLFGAVGGGFALWGAAPAVVRAGRTFVYERRAREFREPVLAAATEARVDPYLMAGIMVAESSCRVDARSKVGALGLFQLMPVTAEWRAERLGLEPPTEAQLLSDAALNARLAADYLSWLLDNADGEVERALVAYNLGPTKLSRQIEKAGGWAAWRAERAAAGDSQLLAYAAKVLHWRDRFLDRGLFEEESQHASPDPPRADLAPADPR
jgi:soluble lytic murein transglycosylase-like protein